MAKAEPLSAKELAIELGTDARTCRKFLRDITPIEVQPGQGGRWTFTPAQVKRLTKEYGKWANGKAEKRAKAAAAEVEELEEVDDDEIEDFDIEEVELEDEDDDEDIEEI